MKVSRVKYKLKINKKFNMQSTQQYVQEIKLYYYCLGLMVFKKPNKVGGGVRILKDE